MAEFEPSDEPETTFRYRQRQSVPIDELIAAAAAAATAEPLDEVNIPFDANYEAASSVEQTIDFDELEEEQGFWELIDNNYNETNILAEDGTMQKENPIKLSKYQLIIKDTIHQQLFVNSSLLTDIGREFNCQINFRRNNGNYALFVRPNDTNYMINVTNGISGPENKERIFFNLSLKTDDSSKKLIKTEYISEYVFDNDSILHMYRMEGKPSVIKKNKIDLNKKERLFNPYLILNTLIKNYLKTNETISMDSSLDIIHSQISKLQKKSLNPTETASLDRIIKMFEKEDDKNLNDKILNGIYRIHQAFLNKSLGHKTVEEIDYKVSYTELYKTNNKFTEMLAYRYALYIRDFEFTKSSDGKYVYTDPFPFKLETPFTATDIYLHRFDRHFNHEYAMDRYDINTREKLSRLADIIELTKSIMMNFISICYKVMNINFTSKQSTVNVSSSGILLKTPIKFQINNIYQGLIWNRASRVVWSKSFNIVKNLKQPSGFSGTINLDNIIGNPSLLKGFKLVGLNIDKMEEMFQHASPIVDNVIAYEIPFIGVVPTVEKYSKSKKPFNHVPIIKTSDKLQLDSINLQGVERNLVEGNMIRDETMNRIFNEYFNQIREKPLETETKKQELVELNIEDLSMFPELSRMTPREIPGVVAIETKPIERTLVVRDTLPTALSYPTMQNPAITAAVQSAAPAVSLSSASVLKTEIPFGKEISKVVIDIRQFKKDILKPIEGESRRERGIRIKDKFRTLIARLEELRQHQLLQFKKTGKEVPASVLRLDAQLKEEGILKKSVREKAYDELLESIDKSKKELVKLAIDLREYERKIIDDYRLQHSKEIYKIQQEIAKKMTEILENKRILNITIPSSIIEKSTNNVINDKLNKELKQTQRPIIEKIKELEEELQKLQQSYVEEQSKFDAAIEAKATATERNIEKDLERQERDRLRMLENDQAKIVETTELLADLHKRADKLKKIIVEQLKIATLPLQKYYKYAQTIIETALQSYREFKTTVEYFADARAKDDKKRTEEMSQQYRKSLEKATNDMKLFTEIEENLNKTQEEILMIAMLYLENIEKKSASREDVAESARAIRRQEILAQREAWDRRQAAVKIAEGQKIAAEKEATLAAATEGLEEKEAAMVVKKMEEKAEEEYKKFSKWGSKNIIFKAEIKQFEDEKKQLEIELADINKKKTDPKFERLQPKDKKKILEKEKEINIKLPVVIRALGEKNKQYNIFLLENESLIRNNVNFKEQSLKAKLIEQIEQYKLSISSRQSIDDAPEGMNANEWAAMNKYLKYKNKYIQLRNKNFQSQK